MSYDKCIDIDNSGEYVDDIDAILQSWRIILFTVKGSDPLRHEFGSDLYNYLDKPITAFDASLSASLIADLEKWEVRATINRLTFTIENESNIYIHIYGIYTASGAPVYTSISLNDLETTSGHAYSGGYDQLAYN